MEQPVEGGRTEGRAHEPALPGEQDEEGEEKDDLDGDGLVEGFSGSFWDAVAEEVIPIPELMGWSKWQNWRSTKGGGRRGSRGREEQGR